MNSLFDMINYDGKKRVEKLMWTHTHTHLRVKRLLQTNEFSCTICSQRKVDIKTITRKIKNDSISFLERIHGDICGPIHLPC